MAYGTVVLLGRSEVTWPSTALKHIMNRQSYLRIDIFSLSTLTNRCASSKLAKSCQFASHLSNFIGMVWKPQGPAPPPHGCRWPPSDFSRHLEHSMCQPDDQVPTGCPKKLLLLRFFQRAKSRGFSLRSVSASVRPLRSISRSSKSPVSQFSIVVSTSYWK